MNKTVDRETVAATPTMITMQQFLTPGSPYLRPEEVANMLGFLRDDIVKALTESSTLGGRVYARRSEFIPRYGVSDNTLKDWFNTLEKDGKIHPIQGAPGNGAAGDVLYHIAEVDAALQERRRAYNARKEKAGRKA